MAKEQGIFTVAEDDQEKELLVVAEGEMWGQELPPEPAPAYAADVPLLYEDEDESEEPKGWPESGNVEKFPEFLMGEIERIGNPSGWRTATEKERGLAQLKQLNKEISKALQKDYHSKLDLSEIDNARNMIEKHIDDIEYALEGASQMARDRKHMRSKQLRKRRGEEDHDLTKEAGTPHFNGMQIHISAFERAIVGALLNGRASGGRDIDELYVEAKKQYGINEREELAIFQILADMGLPTFKDRLKIGDSSDPTREDGFGEWQSQYYA